MAPRSVYISWGISSFFGWGVYGLNLALHWSDDPEVAPIGALPVRRQDLAIDPLRMLALEGFLQRSEAFQAKLARYKDSVATVEAPVLVGVADNFGIGRVAHGAALVGRPTIAVTFFETAVLPPEAVKQAGAFALIVAGSTWNAEVLRAHGLGHVKTVLQGVDPTLFHPAPRLGRHADRFLVFSGGKLERRKGQDIVVAAFRKFAERRPDALLVTAWHSPWPAAARSLDESGLAAPVAFVGEGRRLDVGAWLAASGLKPENVLDLGPIPNAQLPQVLREMDVAVFPNRCEGGTNLVAMECMACGVPAILSRNTGHLDLIEDDNAYVLEQQGALAAGEGPFGGVAGWGESDVDEVVEMLERAYAHRDEARARGARGAATLARLSWARTAAEMKPLVLNAGA